MRSNKPTEDCRKVFAELSAYLDLELPADACQKMEAHIAGCRPCVEFVNSLRRTIELCTQYKPDQLPSPIGAQARAELLAAYRRTMERRA